MGEIQAKNVSTNNNDDGMCESCLYIAVPFYTKTARERDHVLTLEAKKETLSNSPPNSRRSSRSTQSLNNNNSNRSSRVYSTDMIDPGLLSTQ